MRNVLTDLRHQGFFGFTMAQSWTTLYALSNFLQRHRDIKKIVELGTGDGIPTILFGMAMKKRGGQVLTYDIRRPHKDWFDIIEGLPITFILRDVFMNISQAEVTEFIYNERALIFCDNGDKPREMRVYVPLLKVDDYIMAHDWGTEIRTDDVANLIGYVAHYEQDFFDRWSTYILSMRRI